MGDDKNAEEFYPYPQPRCGYRILEIMILILKIIHLILSGIKAVDAAKKVSKESGVGFVTLWDRLPEKYKKPGEG